MERPGGSAALLPAAVQEKPMQTLTRILGFARSRSPHIISRAATPHLSGMPDAPNLPRVVIVGAGFGGLRAAKALAGAPVRLTVVDQHNYHEFQPLLYQVATADLSPADISEPIRAILRRQRNAEVLMARVTGVDTARRVVLAQDESSGEERELPYDFLVVAT